MRVWEMRCRLDLEITAVDGMGGRFCCRSSKLFSILLFPLFVGWGLGFSFFYLLFSWGKGFDERLID